MNQNEDSKVLNGTTGTKVQQAIENLSLVHQKEIPEGLLLQVGG